jgi:hypothetical protein
MFLLRYKSYCETTYFVVAIGTKRRNVRETRWNNKKIYNPETLATLILCTQDKQTHKKPKNQKSGGIRL